MGVLEDNKALVRAHFDAMVFWRIVDGKIVGRWATLDLASVMRQLQS